MENSKVKFLEIVLHKLEQDKRLELFGMGICINIDTLGFEYPMRDVVRFKKWFLTQKPHSRFHSKFTKHTHWLGGDYWWVRTYEGYEQRILFIKHLIEKQS